MAGFVQGVISSTANNPTSSVSPSFTPTTGDTIVVFVDVHTQTSPGVTGSGVLTVTDSWGNTYTEATTAEISGGQVGAGLGFDKLFAFYCINATGGSSGTVTIAWTSGWGSGGPYSMLPIVVELSGVASFNQGKGVSSTPFAGVNTTVGTGTALFNVHTTSGGSASLNLYTSLISFNATSLAVPGIFIGFLVVNGGASVTFINYLEPTMNGQSNPDPSIGVSAGLVFPTFVNKQYAYPIVFRSPLLDGSNQADQKVAWTFIG